MVHYDLLEYLNSNSMAGYSNTGFTIMPRWFIPVKTMMRDITRSKHLFRSLLPDFYILAPLHFFSHCVMKQPYRILL